MPPMSRVRSLLLIPTLGLLAGLTALGAEESFDEVKARTDFASADQVTALGNWCAANQRQTLARTYWNQAIKLDPEHDGARTALGFVRVGEKWLHKSLVKDGQGQPGKVNQPATNQGGPVRQPGGKAPTAAQVAWDLTLPAPMPNDPWLWDTHISKLPRLGNDSTAMESSIATINRDLDKSGFALLCKALKADFGDLYAAADICRILSSSDRPRARKLFAFVAKASEKITDAGDLEYFAMIAGTLKERNAIPRLIELMDHADARVKASAIEAAADITLLPKRTMTRDTAQRWWELNWNVSERTILGEQLASSDPAVQVEAAAALYEYRDRAIMPVLIRLLRVREVGVNRKAIAVISRIAGERAFDPVGPDEQRKKQADLIEKWWREEGATWIWIEDRNPVAATTAATGKRDFSSENVRLLGSAVRKDSAAAENALVGGGVKSIPALLDGLGSNDQIVRMKAHDILKQISKQDHGFAANAVEDKRAAAIAKWRDWAVGQGFTTEVAVPDQPAGK